MRRIRLLPLLTATLLALSTASLAQTTSQDNASERPNSFTPAEQEDIRRVVRSYLIEHPEVLEEAIRALQQRRERERVASARAAVQTHRDALFNDDASPVGGNPEGNVTIVEFFDYQCGFCKRAYPHMQSAVRSDGNVRVVFKEFPILGPVSAYAAQAALAARNQGKYEEYHNALMEFEGELTRELVIRIARSVGLDTDRLTEDMQAPEIRSAIERNFELARSLGINGTPAFVIGDEVIPGAIDAEEFERHIAETREACNVSVC